MRLIGDNAGLVEDEEGEQRLLVGGGAGHWQQWWLRRNHSWEQTADSQAGTR